MTRPATAIVVFARRDGRGGALRRLPEVLARATVEAVEAGRGEADVVVASDGFPDGFWPSAFRVIPQRGDTFEARFLGALEDVAAQGYRRIVAVGIDTPGLTRADVRRAVEGDGVVLGPSVDGGFYLAGLPTSELGRLEGLPWCTARVLTALRARLSAPPTLLAARADVDRPRDAVRLAALLERLARRHLGRALQDNLPPEAGVSGIRPPGLARPAHRAHAPPAHA